MFKKLFKIFDSPKSLCESCQSPVNECVVIDDIEESLDFYNQSKFCHKCFNKSKCKRCEMPFDDDKLYPEHVFFSNTNEIGYFCKKCVEVQKFRNNNKL